MTSAATLSCSTSLFSQIKLKGTHFIELALTQLLIFSYIHTVHLELSKEMNRVNKKNEKKSYRLQQKPQ